MVTLEFLKEIGIEPCTLTDTEQEVIADSLCGIRLPVCGLPYGDFVSNNETVFEGLIAYARLLSTLYDLNLLGLFSDEKSQEISSILIARIRDYFNAERELL